MWGGEGTFNYWTTVNPYSRSSKQWTWSLGAEFISKGSVFGGRQNCFVQPHDIFFCWRFGKWDTSFNIDVSSENLRLGPILKEVTHFPNLPKKCCVAAENNFGDLRKWNPLIWIPPPKSQFTAQKTLNTGSRSFNLFNPEYEPTNAHFILKSS